MPRDFCIPVALVAMLLQGCGSLAVLNFQPDKEVSGVTKDQMVFLEYIRPTSTFERQAGELRSLVKSQEFLKAGIPKDLLGQCGHGPAQDVVSIFETGAFIPFVVAFGQFAFDVVVGAIDSRREQLKKAAKGEYDATLITKALVLNPQTQAGPGTGYKKECIILTRKSGKEHAMVLVLVLDRYAPLDAKGDEMEEVRGLTFTPAYLRVDLAAAQTAKANKGKPKIKVIGSLVISAVQTDPKTGVDAISVVTTTPFAMSPVEIGTKYINPDYVAHNFDYSPPDLKKLVVKKGPLFARLQEAQTVGTISISVIEFGSATAFEDVDAAEKSLRTALRNAIGKSIEARLSQ